MAGTDAPGDEVQRERRLQAALRRVTRGQVEAFSEVVQLCQTDLHHWLLLRCPPGIDVEELLQRSFVAAYRQQHRFRAERGPFHAWLQGIARRELAAECRRTARRLRRERAFASLLVLRQHQQQTDEHDDLHEQQLRRLRRCLERIDPDRRELLTARYGDTASTRALSDRYRIPEGTVKKRLYLAREWLRRCIAAQGGAERDA